MPLELWLAGVLMVSLNLYALGAGADFGGGVWDMLASGPRQRAQRDAIAHAIGPIWEANHVWLILVIVVVFSAFPPAFAAIMTALHIPMSALLVGIGLDQQVKVIDHKLEIQQVAESDRAKNTPIVDVSQEGFFLKSPDEGKTFNLRIGGYAQTDGRFYDAGDDGGTARGGCLRAARPSAFR